MQEPTSVFILKSLVLANIFCIVKVSLLVLYVKSIRSGLDANKHSASPHAILTPQPCS